MTNRRRTGKAIALLTVLVLHSCAGDEINFTCPDPLGSDAMALETYKISCFEAEFDGCFEFRLDGNSPYIQSVYVSYPDPDPSEAPVITDIGKVTCLSDVVQRPQGGWLYRVDALEGHGYVFKMKDGSLGRLFIDSWESEGGVITKVNFTRQYPY